MYIAVLVCVHRYREATYKAIHGHHSIFACCCVSSRENTERKQLLNFAAQA